MYSDQDQGKRLSLAFYFNICWPAQQTFYFTNIRDEEMQKIASIVYYNGGS